MTEDLMEQRLRDRFDGIEVPPSLLRADDLVRAGRQRAVRRRVIEIGAGVAVVALIATVPALLPRRAPATSGPSLSAAAPPFACTMSTLPAPAGTTDLGADAIDPSGRYIVGTAGSGTASRPVLWTAGQPQLLPTSGISVQATDVNAQGMVAAVGGLMTSNKGGKSTAEWTAVLRYRNGQPSRLTLPSGARVSSYAWINAAGDVTSNAGGHVLLWPAGSTTPLTVPLPRTAVATGITDDGRILGETAGQDIDTLHSYVWDRTGQGHELIAPAGEHPDATASRGDWVVGGLWPSGTAARWNLTTGEMSTIDVHGPARAINGNGWAIVDTELVRGTEQVKLDTSKDVSQSPAALSDSGTVVGTRLKAQGEVAVKAGPLIWQCH